ncbi:MAG: hypothetical protein AAF587_38085 [Bacteroidota bacterium]
MNFLRVNVSFLVCFWLAAHLYAQTSPEIPEILPPSPEASAFNKYVEMPGNTYSGTPNISIPIYQVAYGDIQIPISLSYHASGIKVEEEASWVGLGWVLNAGGVISRQIMGKDDLHSPAYVTSSLPDLEKTLLGPYQTHVTDDIYNFDCDFEFFSNLNIPENLLSPNSGLDFQPDQYTYNFGGYSGSFMVKRSTTGTVETFFIDNQDKMRIEAVWDVPNVTIDAFTVTDPTGMVYTFDELELFDAPNDANPPSPTSWYLTKIESPTGREIQLSYTQSTSVTNVGSIKDLGITPICNEVGAIGGGGCPTNFSPQTTPQAPRPYDIPVLSEIDFHYGVVKFYSNNTERVDMLHGNRLDSIDVYMKDGNGNLLTQPKKKFLFEYDYLTSSGVLDIDGADQLYSYTTEQLTARLKLEKVIEVSADGSIDPDHCPTHSFSYITTPGLPAKTSLARDHWGYFNGQTGNTTLFPAFTGIISNFGNTVKKFDGADRSANGYYAQAFSLKQITYPTGGDLTIEYESNTFDYIASSAHDEYVGNVPELKQERFQGTATTNQSKLFPFTIASTIFPQGSPNVSFQCSFVCDLANGCPGPNTSQISARLLYADGSEVPNTVLGLSNSPCSENLPNGSCLIHEGVHQLTLAAGEYIVDVRANHTDIEYVSFTVEYDSIPLIVEGGGLRVAEMTTHDAMDPAKDFYRSFEYHYLEDRDNDGNMEEYSYGKRLARPIYGRLHESTRWDHIPPSTCVENIITSFTIAANSLAPLKGYGGVVGYDQIVEKWGKNGSEEGIFGKIEYQYHNQPDVIKAYYFRRPPGLPNFPHEESALNGMLKQRKEYSYQGNAQFKLVKSLKNDYIDPGGWETVFGMYQQLYEIDINNNCNITTGICLVESFIYPVVRQSWPRLISSTETEYDILSGNSVETTSNYTFDENLYLIRNQSTTNSDDVVYKTEYTYAEERGSGVPVEMYAVNSPNYKHMLNIPIEEASFVDNVLVRKAVKNFTFDSGEDRILLQNNQIFPDGGTEMIQLDFLYDDQSNIEQIKRDVGQPESFLWGFQGSLPIAKVVNASRDDIAYTSFEEVGVWQQGRWTIGGATGGWDASQAKTGRISFDLSGRTLSTTVIGGTYTLSYWAKGGGVSTNISASLVDQSEVDANGFIYHEYTVVIGSGQTLTLSGTGQLDEVRLYPEHAQMNTICYDEDLMIHTQTDLNNICVYYKYDGLKRLIGVFDQDGHLVQDYAYKYYTE